MEDEDWEGVVRWVVGWDVGWDRLDDGVGSYCVDIIFFWRFCGG